MQFAGVAIVGALPIAALAQQQAVKPPIASYWVSVDTAAGMTLPGIAGLGGFMPGMAGGQKSGRRVVLQLGSQRAPADAPSADHLIPPGMEMGPSLPLVTPRQASRPEPVERELPQGVERPRGRLLIYWGCGESVRPGQPVILDAAALAQGQAPNLAARRVSAPAAPSPSRARTYGDWPNQQDAKTVPAGASLKGAHQIKGNYSPEIQFSLGDGQDFMDRVELVSAPRGAGAAHVTWNAVGTATGYFAAAFGSDGTDTIMWSSSEVQELGGMLMDFVPPGEVARLIREKVVLPPSVTECTVPAEVVKRAGGTPILNFIAYGPEANFAQPPRPPDPRQAWEPLWAVKVRFKSTASTMLGDMGGGGRPARAQSPGWERAEAPGGQATQKPAASPDPVQDGINILRGIFGR